MDYKFDPGSDGVVDALISTFNNPRYCDLIVKCAERSWHVSKVVVASRCKWFDSACYGDFKEASEGVITLSEDDPDAVEAMLRYLYTGALDTSRLESPPMLVYVHTVTVADKYGLREGLGKAAARYFQSLALDYDDKEENAGLVPACRELWSNDKLDLHHGLRKSALEALVSDPRELLKRGTDLHEIAASTTLGADLALRLSQDFVSPKTMVSYLCRSDSCQKVTKLPDQKNLWFTPFCPYCGGTTMRLSEWPKKLKEQALSEGEVLYEGVLLFEGADGVLW